MKRIMIDYQKCDGCKNCSIACMQAHRETQGTVYDLDLTDIQEEGGLSEGELRQAALAEQIGAPGWRSVW